jgi:hypothetical protein
MVAARAATRGMDGAAATVKALKAMAREKATADGEASRP